MNVTTQDIVARPAAQVTPVSQATAVDQPTHQSALLLWVDEARQAHQIATSLAKTSFVPQSLRGKPEDITAAILAGSELGLRPMATLRSMDVIQGTPALRAHAMRGLVTSRGHSVQLVTSTPTLCVMRGRRAGEDEWQTIEWPIERAAALGLTGKSEWKKQPQTMLVARATGEICRLIASDVLHAMPYSAEELRSGGFDSAGEPVPVRVSMVTADDILADDGDVGEPVIEGQQEFPVEDPPAYDPTLDASWGKQSV